MNVEDAKMQVAEDVGVLEKQQEFDNALSEFRLLPENAIPIAPTVGNRFATRYDEGVQAIAERHKEWLQNIEHFLNEAAATSDVPLENLVRTTVETLVDYTYMRNPQAEISSLATDDKEMSQLLQKILTALMNKKTSPGVNLRPKILKMIIFAHLTNFGILELTWQDEAGSLEQVLEVHEQVKEKIKKEENEEEVGRLYELLDILQKDLDIRRHLGIGVRIRSPFSLIVDPKCQENDFSDAKWIMDRDAMDIDYIKAEYMQHDAESGKFYFKYRPDVEFDLNSNAGNAPHTKEATETAVMNAIMPDVDDATARLRLKNTVPVVWVYDKTTKLKYLYMEGRWDVPLWVYPDTMELSRFFPFFLLAFSSPLNSIIQSGEVSHYIPFQKEMNKINSQIAKLRSRAFNKYLYNSTTIDKEEVDKLFKAINRNTEDVEAIGIKLRDQDKTLSESLEPLTVPSSQFQEIFDKRDLKESVDRTTRISDAMRGAQFRTNTTNDAVDTYNEFASNRLEGLTDKIELVVEDLLWSMSELVVSKMEAAQINQLLTTEDAAKFKNLTVAEFNRRHNLVIAAGSIEKPTSSAKKKEAVQIIQMLGQFGTAAPRTVLTLVTRLLRSAFSRTLVNDKDLDMLEKEGMAAMQKGVSTQQTPPQQNPKG